MTAAAEAALTIRRPRAMPALAEISAVVERVTGYVDMHPGVLLTVLRSGGHVAGAYAGDRCVGGVYGLYGVHQGIPRLFSEMVAVDRDWQGARIARSLKLDQRSFALEHGIPVITWTFDPLRGRNASLNLRALGARPAGYTADMYGSLPGFSSGWPTDQLVLEWDIASERVRQIMAGADLDARWLAADIPMVLAVRRQGDDEQVLSASPADAGHVCIPVPTDIQAIRARSMPRALEWRMAVREAMTALLDNGYTITWFLPASGPGSWNRYLLSRRAGQGGGL